MLRGAESFSDLRRIPFTCRVKGTIVEETAEISFANSRLEKAFNSARLLKKEFGEQVTKIGLRMAVLRQAPSLAHVPVQKPDRCHALSGNRSGSYAVDLKHPYRLVFEPAEVPVPRKADGGVDLEKVGSIRILGVEDYH